MRSLLESPFLPFLCRKAEFSGPLRPLSDLWTTSFVERGLATEPREALSIGHEWSVKEGGMLLGPDQRRSDR